MLSKEELAAIRARAEKAHEAICDAAQSGRLRMTVPADPERDTDLLADAVATNDIPALLAHVDALEAELAVARGVAESRRNAAELRGRAAAQAQTETRSLRDALAEVRRHIRDNFNKPSAATILGIIDSTPGATSPRRAPTSASSTGCTRRRWRSR